MARTGCLLEVPGVLEVRDSNVEVSERQIGFHPWDQEDDMRVSEDNATGWQVQVVC